MAAISLHLVAGDMKRPLPPGELDAVVGDRHTMTDRLTEAILEPRRAPAVAC